MLGGASRANSRSISSSSWGRLFFDSIRAPFTLRFVNRQSAPGTAVFAGMILAGMSTFTRMAVRRLVPWIARGNEMWAYSTGRPKTRSTVQANEQTWMPENTRIVRRSPSTSGIGTPLSVGILTIR